MNVDRGAYVEASRRTYGSYLGEWLVAIRPTLRPSTFASYSMNVAAYIRPALGGVVLQRLTAADLNQLYGNLLDHGKRDGSGLSVRSVRYVHTLVRKSLADALKLGHLARNVADFATAPRQRTKREMKAWTAEEARTFLDTTKDDRFGIAWRLLLATGMRRGELLGLRWPDVDLDGARLSITRAVVNVNHVATPSEPKTSRGRRQVALDSATVAALRTWKARQAQERLSWGSGYQDSGLVICREDGSPSHPERLTRSFEQAVARSGLRPIRLHDLRHTCATLALRVNVHPSIVAQRLGHDVSVLLSTYSHVLPSMSEQAAEQIGALLAL